MAIKLTSQATIDWSVDKLGVSRCQFDNGYEAMIPNNWGADAVQLAIDDIVSRFDSESPPTNWDPYAGFKG